MSDARWVRITACGNIPPREGRAAVVGDREIAIFNIGDGFLAVDNRCPHNGGPLADGIVAGGAVVCPLHSWKISLHTGSVERPPGLGVCVRSYPTRVEDGIVLVELPAAAALVGSAAAGVEAA
jgi:nitrite reductase (NADH) small subunit